MTGKGAGCGRCERQSTRESMTQNEGFGLFSMPGGGGGRGTLRGVGEKRHSQLCPGEMDRLYLVGNGEPKKYK